ncbi:MAG: helix-turn-helix domain-containing protein [Verrucomicrobiota bacterium]
MISLNEMLAQAEGKTLEFKRDLSSPDKVIRTIVAFANGAGGTLLLGVEDGSRRVRGVAHPTKTEEQLASMIWDRVEPRLAPELQIIPWRKTYVLAVRVFPSQQRPYYIKAQGFPGGVYVRVGSTNRAADPAQVDELRRVVQGRSFDEEPLPGLNTEALDFRAAAECFAKVRRLRKSELRSLQLVTLHQGHEVPTVGGMLLFGLDRLKHFPDAFIRAGSFAGRDKQTILDSQDITGQPVQAIEDALQFVRRNIRRALRVEQTRSTEAWDFPLLALREAIINAVVHADYGQRGTPLRVAIFDDRIEVDNPGGLPPGLTIEDIRQGVSKLRNRVLGRVFHELHLIEQWGSGIQRMTAVCREAGLPEPQFMELGSGFRVTFLREHQAEPGTDDLNAQVLALLQNQAEASPSAIAAHIGLTPRATRDRLAKLAQLGLIVAVASGPRDPRKVFRLARAAKAR